jgi:GTP cyclohydrolase I
MSEKILQLRRPSRANESLPESLTASERAVMIDAAASQVAELFHVLRIDHRDDHNTRDTPRRVAKMLVEETLAGRFSPPPKITTFDNAQAFEGMIVTGPIEVRSTCAHHLMPIHGEAYIGILPSAGGRIVGLSKYDRVVDHFCRRLQIQEELTQQIGDYLMDLTEPRGLAVRISATHMCKTHRGVRATHQSRMVTFCYLGEFSRDPTVRHEFTRECVPGAQ